MTSTQPGEPGTRQLERPPSERYRVPASRQPAPSDGDATGRSALTGPLVRALIAGLVGAAALVGVGGVLASSFGLLLVAGATGTVVGLVLARAAVPGDTSAPVRRTMVVRLAVVLALGAVLLGDIGLWLFALREGGSLGIADYLLDTFGPLVPGAAIAAAVTAWWGATAGPVQR